MNDLKKHNSETTQISASGTMQWYVIQTKPMSEDRVAAQFKLLRDRGVSVFEHADSFESNEFDGLDVFLPKMKSVSHLGGGAIEKLKPLFPNYLFLRWNLNEPKNHRLVKYTRGVNRVLGDLATAVPISNDVIDVIRERTNSRGVIEQQMYKKGDVVKVRRGHLKELVGILDRPVSDSGRVNVLLQIFNRQLNVQLKCCDIAMA